MKIDSFDHTDDLDIFLNDYKHIIIQVHAQWCKPCKNIANDVTDFIQNIKCDDSFIFLKCDYDLISEFELFIEEYRIEKIPYFIFIEYGVMKDSYQGTNLTILFEKFRDFTTKNTSISQNSFSENSDF